MQIASQDDRRVHFQQILLTLAAAALASSTSIPPYRISSPHTHMPATHPTTTTPQAKQRTYFWNCATYIRGYITPNPPTTKVLLQHCLPRAVGHLHCHRSADGIGGQFEGRVHSLLDVLSNGHVAWWLPGWWPRVGWGFNKVVWGCHVLSILLGGSVGKWPV